jgi:hypothetical protein
MFKTHTELLPDLLIYVASIEHIPRYLSWTEPKATNSSFLLLGSYKKLIIKNLITNSNITHFVSKPIYLNPFYLLLANLNPISYMFWSDSRLCLIRIKLRLGLRLNQCYSVWQCLHLSNKINSVIQWAFGSRFELIQLKLFSRPKLPIICLYSIFI